MPVIREYRLVALVAALMSLMAPSPARAQAPSDRLEIGAVELESLLDLQVAAVSLREEKSSRAPASVFVVTADDIRSQGFETLEEVLRSVPGLFGYRDGLYPMMGVRGLGLPSDYTTRLLVMVDGHPLVNSVGIGESYLGRDLPVPMSAVKRVEVIKGPVGSVYGPTAFLGVVNVVTHAPGSAAQEARVWAVGGPGRVAGGGAGGAWAGRIGPVSAAASFDLYAANGFDYRYGAGARTGIRRTWCATATRPSRRRATCGSAGGTSRPWAAAAGSGATCPRRRTSRSWATPAPCWRTSPASASSRCATTSRAASCSWAGWPTTTSGTTTPTATTPTTRSRRKDTASTGTTPRPLVEPQARADWTPSPATASVGLTGEYHRTMQIAYSESLPTIIEDPDIGVGVGPIRKDYGTLNTYLLAEQELFGALRIHGGLTFYVHEIFGSRLTPKLAAVWQASHDDVASSFTRRGSAPGGCRGLLRQNDYINLDLAGDGSLAGGHLRRRIAGAAVAPLPSEQYRT
jgi:outer membrane receptor protein involved in Fe transport